ncbi:hypothetical protein LCGC14_0687600 [marine sediment metagenome]|uniref:Uncharacterized protein n=1 Tax=marine sediment metagenome TaxID=412755 RepID=A0A0F9QRA0_9ZZZZ
MPNIKARIFSGKKKKKKRYTPKKSPMTGTEFNNKYWDRAMWNMP